TLLPWAIGMAGVLYGIVALVLDAVLLLHVVRLAGDPRTQPARTLFLFSILYLFLIFVALLADRAFMGHG
ncbi:MAG TPA: protoheme IX farnesyltransferase, partial [Candidatus Defluviicoccus seviourii]|nr:protoheme IX farnesyltransferase [Candidatus Defluviicoccus seviourii]